MKTDLTRKLTLNKSKFGSRRRALARKPRVLTWVPSGLKLTDILVPIDFSEPSQQALKYAVPFAEQFGAKLILLYVAEPLVPPAFVHDPLVMESETVMKVAKGKLELLCKQQAIDLRLVNKMLVRRGSPYREITDAARGLKVDLIIIATHGYTALKHALLGSTVERVVRHAPCPVLVVRQNAREFV